MLDLSESYKNFHCRWKTRIDNQKRSLIRKHTTDYIILESLLDKDICSNYSSISYDVIVQNSYTENEKHIILDTNNSYWENKLFCLILLLLSFFSPLSSRDEKERMQWYYIMIDCAAVTASPHVIQSTDLHRMTELDAMFFRYDGWTSS